MIIYKEDLIKGVHTSNLLIDRSESKAIKAFFRGFSDAGNYVLEQVMNEGNLLDLNNDTFISMKHNIMKEIKLVRQQQLPFYKLTYFLGAKSFIETIMKEGDLCGTIGNIRTDKPK